MAKPLTVSLSHDLGKAEAIRRIREGIGYVETRYGKALVVTRNEWNGDRLDFAVSALMQSASGIVDVEEDRVTLTVMLPFLLAVMAEKAKSLIASEGTLLLEKKK